MQFTQHIPQHKHTLKRFQILFILVVIMAINACSKHKLIKASKNIEPLVSAQWLKQHLNDSNLIILDTSVIVTPDEQGGFSQISGREQYIKGHIPTAGFADLKGDLSALSENDNDYEMPSIEQFHNTMVKLGVGDHSKVVLYSANNHVWATRLWWMLKWSGFDNVAILDGGLKAWTEQGYELSSETPDRNKITLSLNKRPNLMANKEEVLNGIDKPTVEIIDALPAMHFQGQFSMYARPGHILSATNIPTTDLVGSTGMFKSIEELKTRVTSNRNNRIIAYCGGGIAATSVAFALHRLGYIDVAVYARSLNEWASDSENPMAVED